MLLLKCNVNRNVPRWNWVGVDYWEHFIFFTEMQFLWKCNALYWNVERCGVQLGTNMFYLYVIFYWNAIFDWNVLLLLKCNILLRCSVSLKCRVQCNFGVAGVEYWEHLKHVLWTEGINQGIGTQVRGEKTIGEDWFIRLEFKEIFGQLYLKNIWNKPI